MYPNDTNVNVNWRQITEFRQITGQSQWTDLWALKIA